MDPARSTTSLNNHLDEKQAKLPAESTIFADDGFTSVDSLGSSDDDSFAAAGELAGRLRHDSSPEEAIAAGVHTAKRFVEVRGFADSNATAWGWVFDSVFDLPAGWSTNGADAEGAAMARERFAESLQPAVIAIPDAETILAVPVITRDREGGGEYAGAMLAVPLLADVTPDVNCLIAVTGTAGVVSMQLENSMRARAAERALQFAQAASRTQRALVEPSDRARALEVAIDRLAECSALVGGQAYELVDGGRRQVQSFGDLDAPLLDPGWEFDPDLQLEARRAGRVELQVSIDGEIEAEIVLQARQPLDEVEVDTLNSIATAIAGTAVRFRANATIESLRRSATRRLVEAQERERSMVAADIHDGVLQQLGATAIRLELAQSRVEQRDFDTASTIIADGAKEIRACARELRALLMELRPQVLDDNGLNAALSELGRHVDGVEVFVTSDIPEDLGSEFAITIFRIVQEALTNIEKHAHASRADVQVSMTEGQITIDISDDGVGYEGAVTGPSAEGSHLGLLGMRERAQMFGGTFSIAGASGGGTAIHATLPLDGSRQAGI